VTRSTGATKVMPFSHIIRRDPWQATLDIPKDVPDNEVVKIMYDIP
jgi:hypothetical protein